MQDREPIQVRSLPDGPRCAAVVRAARARTLELELSEGAAAFSAATTVEIEAPDAIYLGIVERSQQERLWVSLEHLLDKDSLEVLRTLWREREPGGEGADTTR